MGISEFEIKRIEKCAINSIWVFAFQIKELNYLKLDQNMTIQKKK